MAKSQGYVRVALRTHKSNTGAVKMYEKNGFKLKSEEIISAYYPLKFIAMCYELDLVSEEREDKLEDDEKSKSDLELRGEEDSCPES